MICPLCHTQNRDDAKFCKGCGQPLQAEAVHAASDAVTVNTVPAGPAPDVSDAQGQENPTTTPVSAQSQAESVQVPEASAASATEDIANAPTLVLTPEKMMAIHSRRWQQEAEREQGGTGAMPSAPGDEETALPPPQNQQDVAEVPTMIMGQGDVSQSVEQSGGHVYTNDEPIPAPPPPPPSSLASAPAVNSQVAATGEAEEPAQAAGSVETGAEMDNAETPAGGNTAAVTNAADSAGEGTEEEKSEESMQPSSDTSVQSGTGQEAAPNSDFPTLAPGTMIAGRYEITQVVGDNAKEHVYQVVDRQGYQHCWNCGSEQNAEGDEFCINCGASLLNVPYLMHEYPATSESNAGEGAADAQEANVLQGNIVNTVVEQGHTYVIEQPQVEQNAFPNGVRLLAACDSDAGNVRRSEPNEDSTLILLLQRVFESNGTPMGVFIVADGLGGHDSGQVASRTTINTISERLVRELFEVPLTAEKNGETVKPFDEDALVTLFQGAIQDANTILCQKNQQDKTDMGSTITGFMIVGDHAYIINVGDSRTYMLRGQQLYQLTTDHSLVGQLVASGLIEPDDVYTHPQRSQIFRSLGDKLNVQIDMFKQQLHPGDIMLSCSDGLWEMVRNPQIESILNNAPDPQTACAQLIEAANTNGGEDNISAVIVFVR
jgi:serine/threonine protein phosphatase PrpC